MSDTKEPSKEAQAFVTEADAKECCCARRIDKMSDGFSVDLVDCPHCLAAAFDQHTAALRERVQELEQDEETLSNALGEARRRLDEMDTLRARLKLADDLAAAVERYGRAPSLLAALAAYRGEEGKR